MRILLLQAALVVSTVLLASPANAQVSGTIAQVQTNPTGTAGVTVGSSTNATNPVITYIGSAPSTVTNSAGSRTYTTYSVFIQDATGGLDLFGSLPTGSTYTPTVGDKLTATGTYSPFDAIPELATMTAISATSSANTVPAPRPTTIPIVNAVPQPQSVQGLLLGLNNVHITNTTTSTTFGTGTLTLGVTDGTNSMTLFYWPTSYSAAFANLGGLTIPTGTVNMTGFVDAFGTTAEFVPFTITAVPEPGTLSLVAAACGFGAILRRRRKRTDSTVVTIQPN